MRVLAVSLLLGSFLFISIPAAVAQPNNKAIKRAKIQKIARDYCPDAKAIFDGVGDYKYEKWARGEELEKWADDYNTVVHETCHKRNYLIGREHWKSGRDVEGYFIHKDLEIVVDQLRVYNSSELNAFVPDSLKERIFRYDTYVGSTSDQVSSQISGIYGMLNEFSAYYHGTKASLELYDLYEKEILKGYDQKLQWTWYVADVAGTMYAYQEFKLFISWYLQYAKLKHPAVYEDCMNNKKLRLVYTLLDDQYGQLLQDYYTMRKELLVKLNQSGKRVALEEDEDGEWWMRVYSSNGGYAGTGIHEEELIFLDGLLAQQEHQILDDFRLPGVDAKTFKSFVEFEVVWEKEE